MQLLIADGKALERSGVTVTASLAPGSGVAHGAGRDSDGRQGSGEVPPTSRIDGPKGDYTIRFSADGFTPVTSSFDRAALGLSPTSISRRHPGKQFRNMALRHTSMPISRSVRWSAGPGAGHV